MDTAVLRKELDCSICLNIYADPVKLRCGHKFCRVCIDRVLDIQEAAEIFECPKCRKRFSNRDSVQPNITLRNIADFFLSTQPKREEVENFCTYCIHLQVPAVKRCVLCEASLCDNHMGVHSKSPEHVFSDLTVSLENRKCLIHGEILKYFCFDDNVCICVSCFLVGDHKGHRAELLPEAAVKMKEIYREVLEELGSNKSKTEGQLKVLQESKLRVPQTAAGIKETVNNLLKNIREQLSGLEKRVFTQISEQEENALQTIKQLEDEQDALNIDTAETKELLEVTDPLTVLQAYKMDVDDESMKKKVIVDDQVDSAAKLDEGLIAETFHTGLCDIVNDIKKHLCIQETMCIVLDANTASPNVLLSDDFKSASMTKNNPNHYDHHLRFKDYAQVLSKNSLYSGYWDIDPGHSNYWLVGLAYSSIERQGPKSHIGSSKKSWGLQRAGYAYCVRHNGQVISLSRCCYGKKIRVYLDYETGRLSFYELGDPIQHLHTFMATFTEPLHAALCLQSNSWITITSSE